MDKLGFTNKLVQAVQPPLFLLGTTQWTLNLSQNSWTFRIDETVN